MGVTPLKGERLGENWAGRFCRIWHRSDTHEGKGPKGEARRHRGRSRQTCWSNRGTAGPGQVLKQDCPLEGSPAGKTRWEPRFAQSWTGRGQDPEGPKAGRTPPEAHLATAWRVPERSSEPLSPGPSRSRHEARWAQQKQNPAPETPKPRLLPGCCKDRRHWWDLPPKTKLRNAVLQRLTCLLRALCPYKCQRPTTQKQKLLWGRSRWQIGTCKNRSAGSHSHVSSTSPLRRVTRRPRWKLRFPPPWGILARQGWQLQSCKTLASAGSASRMFLFLAVLEQLPSPPAPPRWFPWPAESLLLAAHRTHFSYSMYKSLLCPHLNLL